jgi:hypothetical protein
VRKEVAARERPPAQRAVGRLPWLAFFFLRALPLRARLAIGFLPVLGLDQRGMSTQLLALAPSGQAIPPN